jgi:hypothetical protein
VNYITTLVTQFYP